MAATVGPILFAFMLLLTLCSQPAIGQDCSRQCQCMTPPVLCCPAGVSLVLDDFGCSHICTKQQGELCSDPCELHKGLFCDFGCPANHKIGVCMALISCKGW